ncbi:lysosomal acid lipase/cholesteryl ester hydrolase-like [Brevipalpus obovatus]|uniref:lysosomal acid lipase/cholesteryl ester hydrolase-like n=1 Tax=Brevipalpus obovatus TaxID=246614 RepID=UPI003D9F1D3D
MYISNNLAFVLIDAGFDVWLMNTRGNSYSNRHVNMSDSDSEFWKFSYDEMIKYDTPAIINHVLRWTKRDSVGWIGHSQGAMIMFGFLAEFPEQSSKIKPFIAMAPVARLKDTPASLKFISKIPLLPQFLLWFPGEYRPSKVWLVLVLFACSYESTYWCRHLVYFFLGQRYEQLDFSRLGIYVVRFPDRTSRQNLVHYGQNLRDERFAKFDWGPSKNMQLYNSTKSPEYPLERIENDYIALMYSSDDPLATEPDIENLKMQLRVRLMDDDSITHIPWGHRDFLWSKKSRFFVVPKILHLLWKVNNR